MPDSIEEEIIHELCVYYELPKIPVKVVQDLKGNYAFFDPLEYSITIEKGAPLAKLIHEFIHYAFTLVSKSSEMEEYLCDMAMNDTMKEWIKDRPYFGKLFKIHSKDLKK